MDEVSGEALLKAGEMPPLFGLRTQAAQMMPVAATQAARTASAGCSLSCAPWPWAPMPGRSRGPGKRELSWVRHLGSKRKPTPTFRRGLELSRLAVSGGGVGGVVERGVIRGA